jgi:hypothetical protein
MAAAKEMDQTVPGNRLGAKSRRPVQRRPLVVEQMLETVQGLLKESIRSW